MMNEMEEKKSGGKIGYLASYQQMNFLFWNSSYDIAFFALCETIDH